MPHAQADHALRVARRAARWSVLTTLAVCLLVPLAYLGSRYLAELHTLEAELQLDRMLAERIINEDPEFWRFRGSRLQGAMESHVVGTSLPIRYRIRDLQSNVVSEFGDPLPAPVIQRQMVLQESARPVGRLEIGFSLRPLAAETGWTLFACVVLAAIALAVLRRVAIRPLQQLPKDLAAAEAARRLASRSVEAASNPFVVVKATEPDYPIEYVNPAFEQLTGYRQEEAVGRNCRFLQGEDREQPALEELRTALRMRRPARVRLRNYRKDGSLFWNDLNIAPVFDLNNQVTHYVGELIDITDSLQNAEQLQFQATHDPLTGLPNRRMLAGQLNASIEQASQSSLQLSVAYIDLDGFKFVNDSLGHAAGDHVLSATAQRLAACVDDADLFARVGGDEFVLVLHGHASKDAIYETLRRIQLQMAEPIRFEQHEFRMGGSIGVAVFPDDGSDADTLLRNADLAMYSAKQAGHNNIQFYSSEMHDRIQRRLTLEQDLRAALERNELLLYYQPQVSLQDGRVIGLEALLRWRHPQHGMVPAGDFIALAEELGVIDKLGEWALFTACRQAHAWRKAGLLSGAIGVNVSAHQFGNPDFVATVATALKETGIDPAGLELEITESASMSDPQSTVRLLHELRGMGIRLAIDDFGTGYSNLGYLSQFPVDKLKLDQSYVGRAPDSAGDRVICEASVALAHSLGLKVIAEGVENEAQLALLAQIGSDELQGYLFSRPLPADACAELLQSRRHLPVDHLHVHPLRPAVLLVDDDSFERQELERMLAPDDYHILHANTGDAALEMMSRHLISVVVCDNRMPGMSGIELLEMLRVRHPGISSVLFSGYATPEMLMQAINRGGVYKVLTKPSEPAVVRQAVADALRHRQAAALLGLPASAIRPAASEPG
jgi:diguanylate cyclase (GGDEF)-like protein/PAS domain S-box-containing protein